MKDVMRGNAAHEVEGENGRGEELPANYAVIGKGFLKTSGELEGDTPTIAELATMVQQRDSGVN